MVGRVVVLRLVVVVVVVVVAVQLLSWRQRGSRVGLVVVNLALLALVRVGGVRRRGAAALLGRESRLAQGVEVHVGMDEWCARPAEERGGRGPRSRLACGEVSFARF